MTGFGGWNGEGDGGGGGDERDFGGWGGCGGVPDLAGSAKGDSPRVKLMGHVGLAYPKAVRAAVLRSDGGRGDLPAAEMSAAELAAGRDLCGCCGEGGRRSLG